MKTTHFFAVLLLFVSVLFGSLAQAQAPAKGWSRKAKGAAIGAGAGAATGAVVGGGKGALVGAAVGAVGGGIIGRRQDKKKDPVRYARYRNKK